MSARTLSRGGAIAAALCSAAASAQVPAGYPTTPPALGRLSTLKLPPIVQRTLPNGLTLMVVRKAELPVADFVLIVKSGAESDPADRLGVATLTAALLTEGTASRSALDIADQQAYLGIGLSANAGWDASFIRLHTPTAQLDSALALYADVVLKPGFADVDFDRLKKQRLTQLVQIKDRGPQIADRVFPAVIYGNDHPYGRPSTGTEPSVAAMTKADIVKFYQARYKPNNAIMIVVGDVDPDLIAMRVIRAFGSWKKGIVPAIVFPPVAAVATTTIHLVDKPGAAQSSFRIGGVATTRRTADFAAIDVMNTILGGSFTSRLNDNLREKKGYTYGASSRFDLRQEAGPWVARSEVVTAKSDSALLEFVKELKRIAEPVPAAELDKTRQYLIKQMPADFESTRGIAGELVPVALYGLPLDYFSKYGSRVQAVTAADVQRVAKKYIDPDHMQIVVVGDREKIEPGIVATKVAPVVRRDLEAKVVP